MNSKTCQNMGRVRGSCNVVFMDTPASTLVSFTATTINGDVGSTHGDSLPAKSRTASVSPTTKRLLASGGKC